jgi:all-trans-8'-apo-beta-carotenal 15,15'-oxygenase
MMDRRSFLLTSAATTALIGLNPWQVLALSDSDRSRQLSFRANRGTDVEGSWSLHDIEGVLPPELIGDYYKIGPGTKECFGRPLDHYFDGDAYALRFRMRLEGVELSARFVETSERRQEQSAGRMLYHEFGTAAPRGAKGRKNQPNINFLQHQGALLALSEGGAPVRLNHELETAGEERFAETLPKNVSFCAHPKSSGDGRETFAFGIHQSISRALKLFRVDGARLVELYSLNQKDVTMIHDMGLSASHCLFLIPPAIFKMTDLVLGRAPLAKALEYHPKKPLRLLVLDRQGKAAPWELALPAHLVFHHACATEEGDELIIHAMLAKDGSLLDTIANWQAPAATGVALPGLYEIRVNTRDRRLVSMRELLAAVDFPVINPRTLGSRTRFIYAASMGTGADPFAFTGVVKVDLRTGLHLHYHLNPAQQCGEPLFVPRVDATEEDDGHLVVQGYDELRDESFLDVLDAKSFQRLARIWCGQYFPLGFHGTFLRS